MKGTRNLLIRRLLFEHITHVTDLSSGCPFHWFNTLNNTPYCEKNHSISQDLSFTCQILGLFNES